MNIQIYTKTERGMPYGRNVTELTFTIKEGKYMFWTEIMFNDCSNAIEHINMASGHRAGFKNLFSIEGHNKRPSPYTLKHCLTWIRFMQDNFKGCTLCSYPSDKRRERIYIKALEKLNIDYKAECDSLYITFR